MSTAISDLRDRVAIVTGGGRGIGRAIAFGYAGAGADVLISAARNPGEAAQVARESDSLPGTVHAVQADVTVQEDVDRLVASALALRGRIECSSTTPRAACGSSTSGS